jgi:DNA invertase Pin-like site-specific DNA recombinase
MSSTITPDQHSTTARATLTARAYLRVSKDKSGRMRSVAEQAADHERAAMAEGFSLGQHYRESGAVSASRYSRAARPAWDTLTADMAAGTFSADVLMLWEVSRSARRVAVWAPFLETCADRHVRIYVTSHGRLYDPRHPRDMRSLLEDGTDAEYESGKISSRVARAMVTEAQDGRAHGGRAAFGYVRTYSLTDSGQRTGTLTPDPGPAEVVRRIFADIAAGHSLRSIAAALNAEDAPGAPWAPARVGDIGRNPA